MPHPRVDFGKRIRGIADAAIDVSDGFASEVRHLAKTSSVGFQVMLERVAVWQAVETIQACGSDDSYELLFTAAPACRREVLVAAQGTNTPVTLVGHATDSGEIRIAFHGKEVETPAGYDHFDN